MSTGDTGLRSTALTLPVVISETLRGMLPNLRLLVVELDLSMPAEALSATAGEVMLAQGLYALSRHVEETGLHKGLISEQGAIQAGRRAYRTLGKDPTRYRLSSEKLLRRYLGEEGFPYCQQPGGHLVDLFNILSLRFKCPVGAVDLERLKGDCVVVDAGQRGEVYETLSGMQLNLEGLIVSRDAFGPFGSTTADSRRSGILGATHRIQAIVFFFDESGLSHVPEVISFMQRLAATLDPDARLKYQVIEGHVNE